MTHSSEVEPAAGPRPGGDPPGETVPVPNRRTGVCSPPRPEDAWPFLLGGRRPELFSRLRFVALVFLANRLLVYGAATWAYVAHQRPEMAVGFFRWLLVRNFLKFDATWYVRIADTGYGPKSTAFFPLYPVATRALHVLPGVGYATSGLLVSAAAFFLLLWVFLRLMALDHAPRDARRITWLLALFPTAFYFAGIYTESTFMLLSVLALLFMRFRRWGWAAGFGFLAGLTRNTGVLLIIPFLIEFAFAYREGLAPGRRVDLRRALPVLWVGLIGASVVTYMAYLYWRFGDPLSFAHAQEQYGRGFLGPWSTLYDGFVYNLRATRHITLPLAWKEAYYPIQLVFVTLVGVVLVTSWRWLRLSYWVIILYSFLIPLAAPGSGQFDYFISFSRYSLVIVPLYAGLYPLVHGRWRYRATIAVSVALFLVLMGAWSLHRWVA